MPQSNALAPVSARVTENAVSVSPIIALTAICLSV